MDENERVERSHKLIELLKKLADPGLNIDEAKEQLSAELKDIYDYSGSGMYRHRYSDISRTLYDQNINTDQCSLMCDNLEELQRCLQKVKKDRFVSESVEKLIDHIMLESMRLGQIQQVLQGTEQLQSLVEQSNEILKKEQNNVQQSEDIYEQQKEIAKNQSDSYKEIQEMVKEVDKTKDYVHSHHIQSITILSIFAGIVFAFSGGLTLLGGVFTSVSNISGKHALLFIACIILVGVVLIDTIVVLLSFLRKYTGTSINKFWSWGISIINVLALGIAVKLLWSYLQYIE